MIIQLENSYSRILLSILLVLTALSLSSKNVEAAEHCSDNYYINETLPNGSKWDMCWEHRQREGIIFHHIYYTPKNGERRFILNHAAVAQIHVPYDDNGARYHDISDYGIGGNNIISLNSDECPAGDLLNYSGKNVLCKQIESRPLAHKSGNNVINANNLSLFSVSPVGAYYYIPTWRFMDDGTIEPWIGATGALQRYGSNQSRGWKLGDNRVGIAHLHNFFWKLDFDLNGSHLDDVIEEINFPLVSGKRQRTITTFNTEAARKVNPDTMRHWRIKDKSLKNINNHSASFDILINETGHQDIGPASEPFTHNDFYVTKQNNEEKFASHNPTGASNLAEFVNGESIANNDIVVWAGVTFYHMPRSEDAPHMDAHWSHIKIVPRDWHASNPLGNIPVNTPPTISSLNNQNTQQGSSVSLTIQANDVDGDSLSYSAIGLPSGLQINSSSGLISGTTSIAGNYNTTVTVNDNSDSSSIQFNWLVSAYSNTAPTISSPGNQTGLMGNSIDIAIQANDSDGDSLNYSASGLPNGLQINATSGRITGSLSTTGNFTTTVTVSDSSTSANTSFNWVITSPSNSTSNEVSNSAITINGSVSDWGSLEYFSNDADDISGQTNQIDWLNVAIAHSPQNVFMTYQNRQNVDPSNTSGSYIPWGWQAFLDTDNNVNTGYQQGSIGADYVINGNVIERYIGTGTSWSWDIVTSSTLMYSGANVEMSFPRSSIGNPQSMKVIFLGDNAAFNGDSTDRYPDTGFFSYTFTGSGTPNSVPVANNQQLSVGNGASISLILTASDADNDSLSYTVNQQPEHGSLSGSAPNLVYTADDNYTGSDSFRFLANDGLLNSQSATVTITVTNGQTNGAIANYVSSPISVNGDDTDWSQLIRFEDDADDASGNIDWQNAALAHDSSKLYLLYNNRGNIDPSNSSGSYIAWGWQTFIDTDKNASTGYQTGAIGADYVLEGNQIQRYNGSGSNWSWSHLGSVESQYQGSIAELALPLTQLGNPDSIRVAFSGDSSSYSSSGTDLYPNGQNNAQSSIRFFEYDITGGDSGSNGRPIAYTQSVSVNSNSTVNITLVASDPNDDNLTYSIVNNPSNGTLSGVAPNLTYVPNSNFIGQDSFTFNVNDGNSVSSNATVSINVSGSEEGGAYSNPVSSISIDGNNEEWASLSAYTQDGNDIGGINNVIDWQSAATAHNGSDIYFMYQSYNAINTDANNGSFINWGWQTFIDTDSNPNTGYKIGTVGAEYVIEGTQIQRYTGDGSSWSWNNFATALVSYNANTVELGFARSIIGNPNKMRVIFVGDNDAFGGSSIDTYPNALDYFEYQLSGGTSSSSSRPVASPISFSVRSNTTSEITLSASDLDGDTLTYQLLDQPNNGILSGSGQNYIYTPDSDYVGEDSFRYIANDGTFDSSVETVVLNVSENGTNSGTDTNTDTNDSSSSGGGSIPLEWLILLSFIGLLRFRIK